MPFFNDRLQLSVGGIVVSIAAFQAVDPGSIPGHRMLNLFDLNFDFRIVSFLKRKGENSKISFPALTIASVAQ